MSRVLFVLMLLTMLHLITAPANLLEILRIQNQLKSSYNEVERLQAKYKSKIEEALIMDSKQDLRTKLNDDLAKCRDEQLAFEVLNKMYAEQIAELQNRANSLASTLEEKDRQIEEGLMTMATFTSIINEQAKQIELLKDDAAVKSQIILNMQIKTKNIADKLNDLEDFETSTQREIEARSCLAFGDSTEVHSIRVDEGEAFPVTCESRLAGPGWTVVQRRLDGSVLFNRSWAEYQEGFGDLSGEFFLGLEKLHRITLAEPHELYVHLTDFNNESSHAFYDKIVVAGASEQYTLSELGEYSGNAGDSLRDNQQQKFTTYDRDNDRSELNCAQTCLGGWWFNNCGLSNLNGQYTRRDEYYDNSEYGIFWDEWQGPGYTLQSVHILIRPKLAATTK